MDNFAESELILNPDGSIYHLTLLPTDIAPIIFLVGDPARVSAVSKHFDSIEIKKHNREFVTHTGYLNNKRVTVTSTGIGVGCIDIIINELDALVNIDFERHQVKPPDQRTSLKLIRLGTTGTPQKHIPVDSIVLSEFALGIDALACFYQLPLTEQQQSLKTSFINHFQNDEVMKLVYPTQASQSLYSQLKPGCVSGITLTCNGFYAAQGRKLRAPPLVENLISKLASFSWEDRFISNLEMETAGIYSLSSLLGHQCCSISSVLVNRATQKFSQHPKRSIQSMIQYGLETVLSS